MKEPLRVVRKEKHWNAAVMGYFWCILKRRPYPCQRRFLFGLLHVGFWHWKKKRCLRHATPTHTNAFQNWCVWMPNVKCLEMFLVRHQGQGQWMYFLLFFGKVVKDLGLILFQRESVGVLSSQDIICLYKLESSLTQREKLSLEVQ